jgi:hypothetical protein
MDNDVKVSAEDKALVYDVEHLRTNERSKENGDSSRLGN